MNETIKTARPKREMWYEISTFLRDATCHIHMHPNMKWMFKMDLDKVTLERDNITLVIPRRKFDEHWKIVKEGRV